MISSVAGLTERINVFIVSPSFVLPRLRAIPSRVQDLHSAGGGWAETCSISGCVTWERVVQVGSVGFAQT
jgi:hypothetical protein